MKKQQFLVFVILAVALAVSDLLTDQTGMAEAATIEFTDVPPYGSTNNVIGRVDGVNPDSHKVAVYIFIEGAAWWSKPTFVQPLTPIHADSSWVCDITTGGSDIYATQICAFLWSDTLDTVIVSGAAKLPGTLFACASAHACTSRSPREIQFSGYDWWVKSSVGRVGPGPNYFSDDTGNVWVDTSDQLHLRIGKPYGTWQCSEVMLDTSLGYGTYVFQTNGRVDDFDKNVVLGLFTWDNAPDESHREIDIEFSRWSTDSDSNAQYVRQPWNQSGNRHRWVMPEAVDSSTHGFVWLPDSVYFFSARGHQSRSPFDSIIYSWIYTGSNVPTEGNETPRINLWLFNGHAPSDTNEVEVIITRFEFFPWTSVEEERRGGTGDISGHCVLRRVNPNPCTHTVGIEYELMRPGSVDLKVYDVAGKLVRTLVTQRQTPGRHCVKWDGTDDEVRRVRSGVYFCRLVTGEHSDIRKMLLINGRTP